MPTKPYFKTCVLAIAIATLPLFSHAAGLGRLNVLSGLGQPFKGEIDLVAVQPSEIDTLKVGLAGVEAYTAAQLTYPAPALGLRLILNKRENGHYVVQITSAGALDEPVFNLLVDLTWAGGKIQREYTALIDPAGYSGVSSGVVVSPTADANGLHRTENSLPRTQFSSAIRAPKVSPRAGRIAKAAPTASAPVADSYKVKAGDTLYAIAARVKPDGVNLDQVLVGLYQANQDAFDGNMNRLQRGKILHVPNADVLGAVDKAGAVKEIKAQSADWQSYRRQLAGVAAKGSAVDSGNHAEGGRITAKVEDKGALNPNKDQDVLKLSRGAGKANSQPDRLNALEEDVAARKKALDEANQRVADLQKNIKQMEELAALKSKSGAELQQKAEQNKLPATPASEAAGFTQPEIVASAPIASASAVAAIASPVVEQAKPKKRVVPLPPPVTAEPGLVDILMDNALPIGGGLAAVLLGVAGLFWSRRRRQPNVFENSLISTGDLKPNTVLGRTGGGVISTQAENSFLTDFSRQGLGTIDTDEVDPIAEADVYMAYGRDAQAEEILKDALVKDPSRQEIRMKLLEIYAARKDKVAFEEVAADVYAATDGNGPLWDQVVYLGGNLDPENALYARKFGGSEPVQQAVATAGVAMAAAVAMAQPEQDMHDVPPGTVADEKLDFDFEMPDVEPESNSSLELGDSAASEIDLDLDWNVPSAVEPVESKVQPELDTVAGGDEFADLLDLPADAPAESGGQPSVGTEEGPIDLISHDFPMDLSSEFDVELPPLASQSELVTESEMFSAEPEDVNEIPSASFDVSSFELPDLDLSLNADSAEKPDEEVQAVADFSAQLSATEDQALTLPPAHSDEGMEEIDLKFDFNMDEPVSKVETAKQDVPIDLDMEIGSGAESVEFGVDDPVQTKIDLARAYIDMGDVEGAREILQEAEQEGNLTQQNLAKSLLANL
ncbi:MAG: FimV/HubP family polar landmark protein [Formivibrio sp.]|nr:FimV/HubP family polar landmark protein [Formivibrio sp.]